MCLRQYTYSKTAFVLTVENLLILRFAQRPSIRTHSISHIHSLEDAFTLSLVNSSSHSVSRSGSHHYNDVIMSAIASQITSLTIVYSTVYPGADQSKHQSSASLAFVWGIHRGPVNSPHKWPVTRKLFPFDDVIMQSLSPTDYRVLSLRIDPYLIVSYWHLYTHPHSLSFSHANHHWMS